MRRPGIMFTAAILLSIALPAQAAVGIGGGRRALEAPATTTSVSRARDGLITAGASRLGATRATGAAPGRTAPRRLLLVGDSMMVGAKPAIATALAPAGTQTHFVGQVGTGLLTRQMWWISLINSEVDTWNPDAVVIESCCNYATGPATYFHAADGTVVYGDTPRMYQAWAIAARAAVRAAGRRGAKVYWVLTPPASPALFNGVDATRVQRFNEIYRRLGVPLIDWIRPLTVNGTFTPFVAGIDGRPLRVRTYDGLHITPAGDQRVAAAVAAAVLS